MLDPESDTVPVPADYVPPNPSVPTSTLTAIGMALALMAVFTAPIPWVNVVSAAVAGVALILGCFGLASDHRRGGTGKASKGLIILTCITMLSIWAWDEWLMYSFEKSMDKGSAAGRSQPIPALPATGKIHKMSIVGYRGYTLNSVTCSTEIPAVYGPMDIADVENERNPMVENQQKPFFCKVNFKVTNLVPADYKYANVPIVLDDIQALGVVGKTTYPNWNPSRYRQSVASKVIGIKESAILNRWVEISVGQQLSGVEFHRDDRGGDGVGIAVDVAKPPTATATPTG